MTYLPLTFAALSWERLWPIALPLLLGAAGVYFLLPRPRGRSVLLGGLLGLVALVLAGWLLIHLTTLDVATFLFYAFSAIAVVAGTLLVTQQNPARAALSFALVILSTTGLFLLLAAPFLMAATITVYAGAIIVTFLFVLMLAQQTGPSDADARSREPLFSAITGFLLLGVLLFVLEESYGIAAQPKEVRDAEERIAEARRFRTRIQKLAERTRNAREAADMDGLRRIVGDDASPEGIFSTYMQALRDPLTADLRNEVDEKVRLYGVFAFQDATLEESRDKLASLEVLAAKAMTRIEDRLAELNKDKQKVSKEAARSLAFLRPPANARVSGLSGPPATTPPDDLRRNEPSGLPEMPAQNAAYLGRSLFTDYLLPVELAGTLLLIATVGAIAIATRARSS
jgi:NADH-quinone oxidoreductase subunit J